jgi:hypothetical protein
VRFLKRLPSFRRWAAQRKLTAEELKTLSPPACRPVERSTPSGFWSNWTRTGHAAHR